MKYKVGDKVLLKKETTAFTNAEMEKLLGKVVTIRRCGHGYYLFKEDGGEWRWDDRSIEGYAEQHKIVITTDGNETLARLYDGDKVIKTATAKCAPDDAFDFDTGAKLAFERLMEEPKYKVGDRVIIADTNLGVDKSKKYIGEVGEIYKIDLDYKFPYGVRTPKYSMDGNLWCTVSGYAKTPHSEYKFKVGDRVKSLRKDCYGEIGRVICIKDKECHYGVEFENKGVGIHNCEGFEFVAGNYGTSGNCSWHETKDLERVDEVEAQPKPQYFNGKVKCVRTDYKWWTVGKIYEVVDGIITADDGDKYPKRGYRYNDADDVRHAGCDGGKHNPANEFVPVDEEPAFTPHLMSGKEHYGIIGEPTNYKDAIGRPLYVGDVVEHFNDNNESYGDTVIVKSKLSYRGNTEKTFVMGIENACDEQKGTTGYWKIIKKRSFEEVKNGEKIHVIEYVKENK